MNYQDINKDLLAWYDENKRILPWRKTKDPYYIWISEIMLQQTRVEAVIPYYYNFIEHFPTIEFLACASQDELYKVWEGLGYYSRVRNMQVCAKECVEKYNGKLPDNYDELVKLKGIGPYTASAIASIAFGKEELAVDGNVMRVFSRLLEYKEDILKESSKRYIKENTKEALQNRPGDFNQALMDLGSGICIANGAIRCNICPLQKYCISYKNATMYKYPVRINKTKRRIEHHTIIIYKKDNQYYLYKRENQGLLAGMYEFKNLDFKLEEDAIKDYLESCKIQYKHIESLGKTKHVFSHITWDMIGYEVEVEDMDGLFVTLQEMNENYAIPTAYKYYKEKLT